MFDLTPLRLLSSKLGANLNLVQAGGGNTSVKDNGTLWVKASGKWLIRALEEDMFLPVPLAGILRCVDQNREYTHEFTTASGTSLRPSVETAMHAVLPHTVVVHVHAVNTIAWAVEMDAPAALRDRLAGLRWAWIPYVHPGLVLGARIREALDGRPDVLILGNHGLIVAGDDFDAVEHLLDEVERRLDRPAREAPPADVAGLAAMIPAGFRTAQDPEVHGLATDALSLQVAALGTLYPDQCVYVGPAFAIVDEDRPAEQAIRDFESRHGLGPRVLLVAGKGVLVADDLNRAGREVLISVKRVIERVADPARVRPLADAEVAKLINWEAEKYRIALAREYEV